MSTIFSKIAQGLIPSFRVAENDEFYAFLDINPVQEGHTLVIPRREVDYIFDLSDDEIARMNVFAKKVANAIKNVIPCKKIGMAVVGLEVPHAHIHLIPINSENDMNFHKQKLSLSNERMAEIAQSVYDEFNK